MQEVLVEVAGRLKDAHAVLRRLGDVAPVPFKAWAAKGGCNRRPVS